MRFKLLTGLHSQGNKKHGDRKVFKKGAIIEPKSDIEEKFFLKNPDKFEPLHHEMRATYVEPPKKQAPKKKEPVKEEADEGLVDETNEQQEAEEGLEDVDEIKAKLSGMSNKELRELAKDYNINADNVVKKSDLVTLISDALDKLASE